MTALNVIANVAYTRKRPTKSKAFESLKHIIEQSDDELITHLAELYNFFTPPLPKTKTNFDWVASAIAVNDVRQYLKFVHADDQNVVATDGYRLHLYTNEENLNGFYDKNKVNIDSIDDKYVGYVRVINHDQKYTPLSNVNIVCEHFELEPNKVDQVVKLTFEDGKTVAVLKRYFNQAVDNKDVEIGINHSNALQIKYENRIAVIMPIKC